MAGIALLAALLALLAWSRPIHLAAGAALLGSFVLWWPIAVASAAPGAAVEPWVTFCLAGALGLFVAALPRGATDSRALAWTLLAASLVVSVWAVEQSLWGLAAQAARIESGIQVPDRERVLPRLLSGRAFAGFATPAALGGYLVLAGPVVAGLALERRGRSRLVLLGALAIVAAGLVSTRSVTAAVALAVAGGLHLAVRRSGRWATGAVVLAAAAVAFAAVGLRRGEILDPSRWDSPWRLRAGNFRIAVEVIRDHPWIGVGAGGYGEVYTQYRGGADNESRHVHDLPLEMMAELGVVPGLLVGGLFFALFLGPLFRRERLRPPWVDGAGVGLAAFAVHNLADFTAYYPSLLWTAAVVRGAVFAAPLGVPELGDSGAPRWVRRLLVATTIALSGLAFASGMSANALYQARLAAAEGGHDAALRLGKRAARWAPWSINAQLFTAGALLETAGDSERSLRDALERSERAIALSPIRASAREVRARVRARLGDLPGAYSDLAEAARLYPGKAWYGEQRDRLRGELPRHVPGGR
jgi:O-antigen ligase